MLNMAASYILNSLPVVSYTFLVSFSFNIILYIANQVSLEFAGIYLIGGYLTVSMGGMLMGSNFSIPFFLVVLVITGLIGGLISIVLYWVLDRYLKSDAHAMVATFSLLLVFGGFAKLIWGTTPATYSSPFLKLGMTEILGNIVPNYYFLMLGTALAVMFGLTYFLYHTNMGLRFRAMSLDRIMAQSCGINKNVIITATFGISGILAGLAGGLYAPITGACYGSQISALLLGALAVIVGGIGSIKGAFFAAWILGLGKVVAASELPVLELAIPFMIAAFVLIVRPYGLWGKKYEH